jgi:hypothetical protein
MPLNKERADDAWPVKGSHGSNYTVARENNRYSCTCDAGTGRFKKGGNTRGKHCKHIKAIIEVVKKQEQQEAQPKAAAAAKVAEVAKPAGAAASEHGHPAQLLLLLYGARGADGVHGCQAGRGGAVFGVLSVPPGESDLLFIHVGRAGAITDEDEEGSKLQICCECAKVFRDDSLSLSIVGCVQVAAQGPEGRQAMSGASDSAVMSSWALAAVVVGALAVPAVVEGAHVEGALAILQIRAGLTYGAENPCGLSTVQGDTALRTTTKVAALRTQTINMGPRRCLRVMPVADPEESKGQTEPPRTAVAEAQDEIAAVAAAAVAPRTTLAASLALRRRPGTLCKSRPTGLKCPPALRKLHPAAVPIY